MAQPEQDLRDERKIMLENQIKELLSKVEAAGEEGRVEEAAEVMRTVDAIKAELRILVNVTMLSSLCVYIRVANVEAPRTRTLIQPCDKKNSWRFVKYAALLLLPMMRQKDWLLICLENNILVI